MNVETKHCLFTDEITFYVKNLKNSENFLELIVYQNLKIQRQHKNINFIPIN